MGSRLSSSVVKYLIGFTGQKAQTEPLLRPLSLYIRCCISAARWYTSSFALTHDRQLDGGGGHISSLSHVSQITVFISSTGKGFIVLAG